MDTANGTPRFESAHIRETVLTAFVGNDNVTRIGVRLLELRSEKQKLIEELQDSYRSEYLLLEQVVGLIEQTNDSARDALQIVYR